MRTSAKLILIALVLLAGAGAGCSRQARSARHLERGNQYSAAGQYDRAEIEYRNALRLNPDKSPAYAQLGLVYFAQGRWATAIPYLLRGQQLDPDNVEVRLKLGSFSAAVGERRQAQEQARAVIARRPQDREGITLLAEVAATPQEFEEVRACLAKLGVPAAQSALAQFVSGVLALRQRDPVTAEAAFKRAQALDPKWEAPLSALGTLYVSQNKLTDAEQAFKTAAELSPARSPVRLTYARFKLHHGDVPGGKRLLEQLVRETPDYLPAWLNLAELAANEKRFDDCTALLEKVLGRDRGNYEALVLHARVRMATGEPARARSDFENLAKTYPQVPAIQYELALACLATGDTGKALANLNRAVSLAPDAVDPVLLLATLQSQTGDLGGAVISLKKLLQRQPRVLQARLLLAGVYRAQGNLDDALNICQQLMTAAPKDASAPYLIGLIRLQQRRTGEARQAFDKALELAPDLLPPLENLVSLDLAERQYSAARQRVAAQQTRNPTAPQLQLLLARIAAAQNDMPEAEADLLKAVAAQPDFHPAYLMLAQLYARTGQDQKAVQRLQQVLAKNPKDLGALLMLGMIQESRKDYPAARDTYEKLLAISPRHATALNNLAYVYAEHFGQLDKAYELARRARDLQPADPYTADTLGWILYQRGQYQWAVNLLEESAAKLPAQSSVQAHLGLAHYMQGDEAGARIAFGAAQQGSQDFPEKQEVARCLSVLAIDPGTAEAGTQARLEKLAADTPGDPVVMARLSAIYKRQGAPDKAIALYQSALKRNPQNVRATLDLAQLYAASSQELPRALDLAKTAYKLAPDDLPAIRILGSLAYQTGDFHWALSLLQESAARRPGDPELLCDLALAQYSLGHVPDAAAAMHKALESPTSFSRAAEAKRFLDLLALAADPGRASSELARLEQILKSEPDYVPALMAQAAAEERKPDLLAARQAYEKVLTRFPDFVPAKRSLAILLAANPRDDKRAYELASKARESFPDDAQLAKTLGILSYRQGNYTRAVGLLKESARQRPGDAQLVYYLGMAQYRLKQPKDSKQSLQRALELNLSGALADEAKRVLAELK